MSPETEPTPWELMRVLRTIDGKIDNLVTKDVFAAETRRTDERFASQGQDIVDERAERVAALAAEKSAREKAILEVEQDLNKAIVATGNRLDSLVAFARWAAGAFGAVALAVLVFVLPHLRWGS
ncbi:hypothetical protein GCM10025864_39740 [Luteimicrobium album]|uniref:DUF1640 domain-containing protein n=1 Tax=Luteimicrobium album TaxID=1054550 RepID=A0ABQ6I609_9MICO|nr:hypothetical protein [Luteimicrobium album]GMA26215.1 hypothetical protein GCM10025864_39740 [Luteimicrobium album]